MRKFDVVDFRAQFPVFNHRPGLVYLDNAATTQCPQQVIHGITDFLEQGRGNAHRGSHLLGRIATEMIEKTRGLSSEWLDANDSTSIVFTRGTTESLNLLAMTLCINLEKGDEILLSYSEHHANIIPWQIQAAQKGLVLKYVNLEGTEDDINQIQNKISSKTKIASLSAASNVFGNCIALNDIAKVCRQFNCIFIVDAAQRLSHHRLSVKNIDCDFLVCSAHKFYGPTGIGILYGKPELFKTLPPWQSGGAMIQEVKLFESSFLPPPQRFEAGTASLESLAGLQACYQFLNSLDFDGMCHHKQQLLSYAHDKLSNCSSLKILTQPHNNTGIISFTFDQNRHLSEQDLLHWLDEKHIAVRAGQHCAQPLLSYKNLPSVIRTSIAGYNTYQDIDTWFEAIKNFISLLEKTSMDSRFNLQSASTGEEQDASHHQTTSSTNQTPPTIDVLKQEIKDLKISQLNQCHSWQQRYKLIMTWGKKIQRKDWIRVNQNLVQGCETPIWCYKEQDSNQAQWFHIDCDSKVLKGLSLLILLHIQGKTHQYVTAFELEKVFQSLSLAKHLSPSRTNGLMHLHHHMVLQPPLQSIDESIEDR